jgi:hypothetical protein
VIKIYSGIGSREAPLDIQARFTKIAKILEKRDYLLRSGGAPGSDKAFERGVLDPYRKEIWRPGDCTPEAEEMASRIHPAWDKCNSYVRKLHGRNCFQILGKGLDLPSQFVVTWTPGGAQVGGTRTALVLAEQWKIPTYNFFKIEERALFYKFLGIEEP